MEFDIRPAAHLDAGDLASLFCAAFAGYFVPVHVDATAIGNMGRRDSVDLGRSCIAVLNGQAVGFMLLAFRGRGVRIAAMGVRPEARRSGMARRMVEHAIREGRAAGCIELVLEVITANEPAVRLYESMGFRRVTSLLGFTRAPAALPSEAVNADARRLTPTDASVVAGWIARHGAANLPWQLAAETIGRALPGHTAFEWKDHAACLISDPMQDRIALLSLVVDRGRRRSGVGRAVLNELMHMYPGRTWRVPEIVPIGDATEFLRALGWQISSIQQYLMTRPF